MVSPAYGVLSPESGLVDFGRRGSGADAAKSDAFHGKGIARAEDCAYVVETAYVVEHDGKTDFRQSFVMLDVDAV